MTSDNASNQLIFNFSATAYNGWPRARLLVNCSVIRDFVVNNNGASVAVDLDIEPGEYTVEIHRYGKTNKNILFVDGEIVQDQSIALDSIYYNNIRLPLDLLYLGHYSWDGNQYPRILNWGPNGVWHWKFGIPFVTWAMDNSKKLPHSDMLYPHKDNIQELKDKIKNLRSVWQ